MEGGGRGNSAAPERSAGAKRRRSVVGISLVKSSDFVQETQPVEITIKSYIIILCFYYQTAIK